MHECMHALSPTPHTPTFGTRPHVSLSFSSRFSLAHAHDDDQHDQYDDHDVDDDEASLGDIRATIDDDAARDRR